MKSTDSEAAGGLEEMNGIGDRLARLRMEHGYSIRRLAEHAGVSASVVSDAERGKVEPSISSLKRLAEALGANVAYFFTAPSDDTGRVLRAASRPPVGAGSVDSPAASDPGVTSESLSFDPSEGIPAVFTRFEPGASLGERSGGRGCEHWGFLLRGRLKVCVGDEIHFLDVGDSISFSSTMPHRFENLSNGHSEYLWIEVSRART